MSVHLLKKSSPLLTLSLAFNSSLLAQTKWSFHFLPGLPGPQVVVSSVALRACKVHSSSSELSSIITELTVAFPVWSCLAWVMLCLNQPPDKYSPVWRRSGNQRLILPVTHSLPTRWSNYNTHIHTHTMLIWKISQEKITDTPNKHEQIHTHTHTAQSVPFLPNPQARLRNWFRKFFNGSQTFRRLAAESRAKHVFRADNISNHHLTPQQRRGHIPLPYFLKGWGKKKKKNFNR